MSDTYVNSSNLSRFWTNAKQYVDGLKDEVFAKVTQRYDGTQFVYTCSHTFAQLNSAISAGKAVIILFDGVKDTVTLPTHYYRSFLQLDSIGPTVLVFYGIDAYNNDAYGIKVSIYSGETISAQFTTLIEPPSPVYTSSDQAKLTAITTDSGWVDLSFYINTTNAEVRDGLCRVRRIGDICMLQVSVTTKTNCGSGSTLQLLDTIPSDYVNGAYIRMATLTSDGYSGVMSLQGAGTVVFYNRSGKTFDSGKWINGTAMYMVGGTTSGT